MSMSKLDKAPALGQTQPMLKITHTSPRRVLGHLRRLQREGEAILSSVDQLTLHDEYRWDGRVWNYIEKIAADPDSISNMIIDNFDPVEMGFAETLFPPIPTREEADRMIRKRMAQRLVTLASVTEQVEAIVEKETAS